MKIHFEFTADFDYHPLPGQTVAYKAGETYEVSEAVAEAAEAAEAGVAIVTETDGSDSE